MLSERVRYVISNSYTIDSIPWFEGLSVVTVPIHEGEAEGEGSYHSIIPMLPWYNYFIP